MSVITLATETYNFVKNAEYSGQEQEIDDDALEMAERLTSLDADETLSMTLSPFESEFTMVASGEMVPRVSLPLVGGFGEVFQVRVEAVGNDTSYGTMVIRKSGLKEGGRDAGALEEITLFSDDFLGSDAGDEVHSYLAMLLRQLAAESYETYVGAREVPPGVTLQTEDVISLASAVKGVLDSVANLGRKRRSQTRAREQRNQRSQRRDNDDDYVDVDYSVE